MLLAAIILWLLFAFIFWCMMIGATRGDLQIGVAMDDRTKAKREEKRALVADIAGDQEPLSNAA
jgi:hypothetical protein